MKPPRMPDLSAGACVGRLDVFDDIDTLTAFAAIQVCKSGCPVLGACRDWGLRHEKHGVWGALSYRQLTYKRKQLGIHLQEPRYGELAPRPTRTDVEHRSAA